MSRKTLEYTVHMIQDTIDRSKENTKALIAAGIAPELARLHTPKPEAQFFVDKMNRLFAMMDRREIVTADDMLKECEFAEHESFAARKTFGGRAVSEADMRVTAARTVALDLFSVTPEDVSGALRAGFAQAFLEAGDSVD